MTDKSEIKDFWEKRTEDFKEKAPVHIGKSSLYNKLMTRAHSLDISKGNTWRLLNLSVPFLPGVISRKP